MKQGAVIQWSDSQRCILCEHAIFIDVVIDGCGTVYVCPLAKCIHGYEHNLTQLQLMNKSD